MSGVWYRRYPADVLHATSMLSCEQKGAYNVLIDMMFERGGLVPDDPAWIARMCGCSQRKWTQTLRPALISAGKISVTADGMLSNGTVVDETNRAIERIRIAREAGRKGGAARANNAPINHTDLWNINTIESEDPSPSVAPVDKAPINSAQSRDINTLAETALQRAAPVEESATNLSRVYRPDKPPIIESKANEINTHAQADSGLRKEEVRKKEDTPLRGVSTSAVALALLPLEGSNVVMLPAKGEQQAIVEAWNAVAADRDLPKVVAMPRRRQRQLALRISEVGFDGVMRAIENVRASAFCSGQNDRGWRADFDFLLQSTSLVRLIEGRYADRAKATPGPRPLDPSKLTGFNAMAYKRDLERSKEAQALEVGHG